MSDPDSPYPEHSRAGWQQRASGRGLASAIKSGPERPIVVCSMGDGTTQQGEVLEAIAQAVRCRVARALLDRRQRIGDFHEYPWQDVLFLTRMVRPGRRRITVYPFIGSTGAMLLRAGAWSRSSARSGAPAPRHRRIRG